MAPSSDFLFEHSLIFETEIYIFKEIKMNKGIYNILIRGGFSTSD